MWPKTNHVFVLINEMIRVFRNDTFLMYISFKSIAKISVSWKSCDKTFKLAQICHWLRRDSRRENQKVTGQIAIISWSIKCSSGQSARTVKSIIKDRKYSFWLAKYLNWRVFFHRIGTGKWTQNRSKRTSQDGSFQLYCLDSKLAGKLVNCSNSSTCTGPNVGIEKCSPAPCSLVRNQLQWQRQSLNGKFASDLLLCWSCICFPFARTLLLVLFAL